MERDEGTVIVDGSFYYQGSRGVFSAGTMIIKGDFSQLSGGDESNFQAEGTHKVLFDGEGVHKVFFYSAKVHIYNDNAKILCFCGTNVPLAVTN